MTSEAYLSIPSFLLHIFIITYFFPTCSALLIFICSTAIVREKECVPLMGIETTVSLFALCYFKSSNGFTRRFLQYFFINCLCLMQIHFFHSLGKAVSSDSVDCERVEISYLSDFDFRWLYCYFRHYFEIWEKKNFSLCYQNWTTFFFLTSINWPPGENWCYIHA